MESSRSLSPGARHDEATPHPDFVSVPAQTTSMTEADYAQLISALSTATGILTNRSGELNAADLRIRSLVSIAEKEAKRAALDARSRSRVSDAENQITLAT